jgi:hypothetical protein
MQDADEEASKVPAGIPTRKFFCDVSLKLPKGQTHPCSQALLSALCWTWQAVWLHSSCARHERNRMCVLMHEACLTDAGLFACADVQ